jgi:hypothetical protein
MTEKRDAGRVLSRASYKVGAARDLYKELFGVAHNSKALGAEFCDLLEQAIIDGADTVQVPVRIALGLYLRTRMGRSSGNQGKPKWHERQQRLFEKRVRKRKAELKVDKRMPPHKCDDVIIDEFHNRVGIFEPTFGYDELEPFGITEAKVWRWLGRKE